MLRECRTSNVELRTRPSPIPYPLPTPATLAVASLCDRCRIRHLFLIPSLSSPELPPYTCVPLRCILLGPSRHLCQYLGDTTYVWTIGISECLLCSRRPCGPEQRKKNPERHKITLWFHKPRELEARHTIAPVSR